MLKCHFLDCTSFLLKIQNGHYPGKELTKLSFFLFVFIQVLLAFAQQQQEQGPWAQPPTY